MISITEQIITKCPELRIVPEYTNSTYGMITSGGVEIEVGEWIYALTRLMKPSFVLETGTYHGLSSSYIALALKENGTGSMVTIDPLIYENRASHTWEKLGISDIIEFKRMPSLDYTPDRPIDILFLDSEPCYRYKEFVKFFDNVNPGGIILIHDLHPSLSYNPKPEPKTGMYHWPFGDFREFLGTYIKSYQIQTFSFPSPRGFTVFQKWKKNFSHTRFLRGEI